MNVGDRLYGEWTNFEKMPESWHDGMTMTDEAAALNTYRIYLLFSIVRYKLDIIRNEWVICLQISSVSILPNIIKIGQSLTE